MSRSPPVSSRWRVSSVDDLERDLRVRVAQGDPVEDLDLAGAAAAVSKSARTL